MTHRPCTLVTSLALLIGAAAVQAADDLGDGSRLLQQPGPEFAPGSRLQVNAQRQVVVQGLIDLDALIQGNYLDANNAVGDHRGYGLIRAELGTKVKTDEHVTATITIGYYDEAGSAASNAASTSTTAPTVPSNRGRTVVKDAYVDLNQFLSSKSLGIRAGRMPVRWNLRVDKGAFLYDSRANDPAVDSWDGARASYNYDTIDVTPYAYRLPDNSSLFGAAIDWKPGSSGDTRTFLTGSVDLERNVVLRPVAANPGGTGRRLVTFSGGAEFEINEFNLYGEYASQRGEDTNGVRFYGWGANVGIDWRTRLPTGQQFILGAKADYLSGDNDSTDNRNYAFINNWEGTSDCYIVEHEKYGELSRYLQGNLEDLKLTTGISFDEHNRIRLGATYGVFRMPNPLPGQSREFGQEGDLTLTWQYTYNATFRLFGGAFKPHAGFVPLTPVPAVTKFDLVYLMGLNLGVVF
ncbi:MAG: alginate export family protein [Planctomycetes bacterium]|nr:alginate export family protein [Planctomycetota bacterium]